MDSEHINTLGGIINTKWGRTSTSISPTVAVNAKLATDEDGEPLLVVECISTVTYSGRMTQDDVVMMRDECMQYIDEFVKRTRAEFKDRTGESLGMKLRSNNISLEHIDVNRAVAGPTVRSGYVRLTAVYDLDV